MPLNTYHDFSDKGNEIILNFSYENNWFICEVVNTIERIPLVPVASGRGYRFEEPATPAGIAVPAKT